MKYLYLDDNDLFGDITVFEKLPRLERLVVENCSKLEGDIVVFEKLLRLERLNVMNCPKLHGDREALRKALTNCSIFF